MQLSKNDINHIYSLVESSMGIKLSAKGKSKLKPDITLRIGICQGDKERLFKYFENYDNELRKIYSAWDSYDREAWIYNLTK